MMRKIMVPLCVLALCGLVYPATVYAPVAVKKTATQKIYVHLMPWFQSKDYSGAWGLHWKMANKNPDIVDGTGKRQIASYYYPLIGPYDSGDPDLVEYQLLLMKLAGVDGVLVDWSTTLQALDYPVNVRNAEAVINAVDKVGLQFAIVWEDNNYNLTNQGDKIGVAKNDMNYAKNAYFNKSSYIKVNGAPMLLVFGPQAITTEANWTNVFSVLSTKPAFLTLWYEHDDAGANCKGEYAWIYKDYLTGLTYFYDNRPDYGTKMGVAYPGFDPFYAEGGWGTNAFKLSVAVGTFQSTLNLALASECPSIQMATWNDFGEGSMIEPTRELGYGCLTTLQQKLGVSYTQADLEMVLELYNQRKKYKGNATQQERLTQVFYDIVSLKIAEAKALLTGNSSVLPSAGASAAQSAFTVRSSGPRISLAYCLSAPSSVRFSMCDVAGRVATSWSGGHQQAGFHAMTQTPGVLAAGIYTCVLRTNTGTQISKLIIDK